MCIRDRKIGGNKVEEISKTVSDCMNGLIPDGSPELEDGDYIGQDGLVYCGKCHTPKQKRLNIPAGIFGDGGEKIVSCLCKCRVEAENRRKEQEKYQQEMMRLQRMRDASLMDSKYRDARFFKIPGKQPQPESIPAGSELLKTVRPYVF